MKLRKKTDNTTKTVEEEEAPPAEEDSALSGEEEDMSEDEAPESVSFGKSREDALESMSQALNERRRLNDLKKEKRRKRHALLKQQRQSKIDLSSARLPESVLNDLQDSQSQNKSEEESRTKEDNESGSSDDEEDEGLDEDDDEEEEEDGGGGLGRLDGFDDDLDSEGEDEEAKEEDYLPFEAVPLSETKDRVPAAKESALEFLNKHLYGGRVNRISVTKHVSKLRKKHHQPALHFTKQDKKKLKKKKKQMKKSKKGKNWGSLLAE